MSSRWQQSLVKDRLDADLLAAIGPHCSPAEAARLAAPAADQAGLRALAAAVARIAPRLPAGLREDLGEQMAEIGADNRWLGTVRGRYVMAVNLWVETFHREFRSRPEFAKVCIGAHTGKEVVCLGGSVGSQQVLENLLAYVVSKQPPYKLLVQVALET
jgi:hypothetical protein